MTPEGLPLAYEVFAGNRADVTTVEEIIEAMEKKYGSRQRIWVLDRGMVSEENIEFLRAQRRPLHRRHAQKPVASIRKGAARSERLEPSAGRASKSNWWPIPMGRPASSLFCAVPRRVGKKKRRCCANSSSGCWTNSSIDHSLRNVPVAMPDRSNGASAAGWAVTPPPNDGRSHRDARQARTCLRLGDQRKERTPGLGRDGSRRVSASHQLPAERSGPTSGNGICNYQQAEAAFRISKSDLSCGPVFHQKTERVEAHILVCFLALALWRTLEMWMRGKGLGNCARQLLKEVATVRSMDVILPVKDRGEVRLRVVAKTDRPVAELLHRLGLILPRAPEIVQNVVEKITR